MLGSILQDVIVAILVIIVFAGRERAFQAWIARIGWRVVRRAFVKMMIDACDGYAQAAPSINTVIGCILTMMVLQGGLYLTLGATLAASSAIVGVEAAPGMPVPTPQQTHDYLLGLEVQMKIFAVVTFVMMLLWMTHAHFRARVMFHISRTVQRLSSLATKTELKPLLAAESRVRNEATLKTFVMEMKDLAAKYELQIGIPIDLWDATP